MKIFSIFFISSFLLIFTKSEEWFSSLGHMEELINSEVDLVSSLDTYLKSEYNRLNKLQQNLKNLESISKSSSDDVINYLSHPINQFRLIKRLGFEWKQLENLLTSEYNQQFIKDFKSKQINFPSESDLQGSVKAILRLQDTYKLDVGKLADGNIKGIRSNQSLTAEDCYYIGRESYLNYDYFHCKLWMSQALSMDEDQFSYFTRFDVLDHLAICTSRLGGFHQALRYTSQMLEIEPENTRIQSNYQYFRQHLKANKKGDDDVSARLRRPEITEYERLCRVTSQLPSRIEKQLKCYYWTNNNQPRLLLSPAKLEEMYPSPHIVRFHDVISDYEIDVIKRIAKPRLYRATVQNPQTGVLESADYRVSKSAWLKDEEDDVIKRVCQRITDVTGLSMDSAEDLQIANYGIGGQYEPHFDYARESDAGQFDDVIGNRIATFLIYLTDIEFGGSTVFLEPEIAAKPIKGSAVFWYNLYPSGRGDERTRHAACPVLVGVKWVGNKWIHERGQEFRRRCPKDEDHDNRIF